MNNVFIENAKHPEVKRLLIKFFEEADNLYKEMDNLSKEEYEKRSKEMWEIIYDISLIDNDFYLISLYGLNEKAEKLFGPSKINILPGSGEIDKYNKKHI